MESSPFDLNRSPNSTCKMKKKYIFPIQLHGDEFSKDFMHMFRADVGEREQSIDKSLHRFESYSLTANSISSLVTQYIRFKKKKKLCSSL